MPLELQIIRASEFIRLGARERLDLAASREMLKLLARACWLRDIHRALLDLRDLQPASTPMLTPRDLAGLVNAFCRMGFSKDLRLAVLYSADPHRRARGFASMTMLRGWNVKATENFEDALLWLSQGKENQERVESGAQAIPIQVKRMTAAPPEATPPRKARGGKKRTPPPSGRRRPPKAAAP